MNIVLISSGLNVVAKQFDSFPGQPVGIIELHSNDLETWLESVLRRANALLKLKRISNLKGYAAQHGLQYAAIFKRDVEHLQQTLESWETDLVITAYCPMVPMAAINNLSHGAINLHPSLLPDYRGGSPLFWQVHDQVEDIGATVHQLSGVVDTGPIIAQSSIKRPAFTSKQQLTEIIGGQLGIKLLRDVILKIQNNTCSNQEQPKISQTRYASNFPLRLFEEYVDLQNISLTTLHDLACFYGEWPAEIGKYTSWRRLVKWIPTTSTRQANTSPLINGSLLLDGLSTTLWHEQGHITLRPVFSIKHLIKAILLRLKGD